MGDYSEKLDRLVGRLARLTRRGRLTWRQEPGPFGSGSTHLPEPLGHWEVRVTPPCHVVVLEGGVRVVGGQRHAVQELAERVAEQLRARRREADLAIDELLAALPDPESEAAASATEPEALDFPARSTGGTSD